MTLPDIAPGAIIVLDRRDGDRRQESADGTVERRGSDRRRQDVATAIERDGYAIIDDDGRVVVGVNDALA